MRANRSTWRRRVVSAFVCAILVQATALTVGAADEANLPVIPPELPECVADELKKTGDIKAINRAGIRNYPTFDEITAVVTNPDDRSKGLLIDLKNPNISGVVYSGPYPFEAGESDYDHARYRAKSRIRKGKAVIDIKKFFKPKYDANDWGAKKLPCTGSIGYRLDLYLTKDGRRQHLGFYDGVASFTADRPAGGDYTFVKNPGIIEGPFIAKVTSDKDITPAVAFETDRECECSVRVSEVGKGERSARIGDRTFGLGEARSFTGDKAERHEIELKGLEPDTEYAYRVECSTLGDTKESVHSEFYRFRTAPLPGRTPASGAITVAFVSDSREGIVGPEQQYMGTNLSSLGRIAAHAYRAGADMFLFGGDLVNGYTPSVEDFRLQLKGWKQVMAGFWRERPVYPCIGNHEALSRLFHLPDMPCIKYAPALDRWPYDTESAEAVFKQEMYNPENGPEPADSRRPPYSENVFTFQYGPLKVIAFNNNYWYTSNWSFKKKPTIEFIKKYGGSPEGYVMADQLAWIKKLLADAQADDTVKYVILYAQEPVFPCGGHVTDAMWYYGNNDFRAYVKDSETGEVKPEKAGIIEVRNELWKAVAQCSKVAAVMSGDEHAYHRLLITDKTPVGIVGKDEVDGEGRLKTFSPNSDFTYPTWHITAGTAGAPFYARQETPWAPEIYSSQAGYTLLRLTDSAVSLQFITLNGQVVDEISDLMAVKTTQLIDKAKEK